MNSAAGRASALGVRPGREVLLGSKHKGRLLGSVGRATTAPFHVTLDAMLERTSSGLWARPTQTLNGTHPSVVVPELRDLQ